MDYIHSNGPAPGYAIESDSEDDLWEEEEEVDGTIKQGKPSLSPEEEEQKKKKKEIQVPDWKPNPPDPFLPKNDNNNNNDNNYDQLLIVLIGEAGLLVASSAGFFPHQEEEFEEFTKKLNGLDDYLFTTTSTTTSHPSHHRFVLVPSSSDSFESFESTRIPKFLQSLIARKLLNDFNPNKLIIFSTYINSPSFQQQISSSSSFINDDTPIRFLSSCFKNINDEDGDLEKLGAHSFHVPNLINGFEAALMIQATIRKIDSRIILLPKITRGPYNNNNNNNTNEMGGDTSSLIPLNAKDRRVLCDIIVQQCHININDCKFPPQHVESLLAQILTPKIINRNFALNHHHHHPSNHLKDSDIGLMYL